MGIEDRAVTRLAQAAISESGSAERAVYALARRALLFEQRLEQVLGVVRGRQPARTPKPAPEPLDVDFTESPHG